jgi:hypothetical protein
LAAGERTAGGQGSLRKMVACANCLEADMIGWAKNFMDTVLGESKIEKTH